MPRRGDASQYVFLVLFLGLLVLAFFIVRPYFSALVGAAVLAFVFRPLYTWLVAKTRRRTLSSLIVCILIVIIITVPSLFLASKLAGEARFLFVRGQQIIAGGTIVEGCTADSSACLAINSVVATFNAEEYKPYLQTALTRLATWLIEGASETLLALPSLALNIFILFFVTFYLLRDGDTVLVEIKRMLPVRGGHRERIFMRLADTTRAIVYGYLTIALLQGFLGAIALWAAGVTSWVFWAIVMAICALVPVLGTGLVWAPAGILLVISGSSSGNTVVLWQGIGLLLFGALVISSVDNILTPRLVGKHAGVHPVFVLLGVVGGIAFFGIIGFVLGPLCLALLTSVIDIYVTEVRSA